MKQKINAIIANLIIIFVSVLTCDKVVQTNMCNYFIRTDGSYNLINIIAIYTAIFIFVAMITYICKAMLDERRRHESQDKNKNIKDKLHYSAMDL